MSQDKNLLDVAQIFQTFIAFSGDVDRTALAMDLDRQVILDLSGAEGWANKISGWNSLREGDPRDVQIQINRAVNYVQSHRMRSILDKVVTHLNDMDANAIVDLVTKTNKHGTEFSARPLTDLVKALETVQMMTQRALGDSVAERPEGKGEAKGSRVALEVMAAMNAADAVGMDSVDVVRRELAPRPTIRDCALREG